MPRTTKLKIEALAGPIRQGPFLHATAKRFPLTNTPQRAADYRDAFKQKRTASTAVPQHAAQILMQIAREELEAAPHRPRAARRRPD